MPPKAKPTHLRCTDGFMLPDRTVVKAGQIVEATDRVVKAAPNNFGPMDDVVESATRAPNERRLLPKRNPDAVVMQSAATKRNTRRNAGAPANTAPAKTAADDGTDGKTTDDDTNAEASD